MPEGQSLPPAEKTAPEIQKSPHEVNTGSKHDKGEKALMSKFEKTTDSRDALKAVANPDGQTVTGEATSKELHNYVDVFNDSGINIENVMKENMGMDEKMVAANMEILKTTELSATTEMIENVAVTWLNTKDAAIPSNIHQQIATLLNRGHAADGTEIQRIAEKGMEIVILPESGINRPFISANRIYIPSSAESDYRSQSRVAHEFSHYILYEVQSDPETAENTGRSGSKAIAEGAAISLCDTTYYTKRDNPTLRSADVSLNDALFLNGWKAQQMREALIAKGVTEIPTSPSLMTRLLQENNIVPITDVSYVYGAALMQEVNSFCNVNNLPVREKIKTLYANSAKPESVSKAALIEATTLTSLGISTDEETRIILQSLVDTFSVTPQEAANVINKATNRVFGVSELTR